MSFFLMIKELQDLILRKDRIASDIVNPHLKNIAKIIEDRDDVTKQIDKLTKDLNKLDINLEEEQDLSAEFKISTKKKKELNDINDRLKDILGDKSEDKEYIENILNNSSTTIDLSVSKNVTKYDPTLESKSLTLGDFRVYRPKYNDYSGAVTKKAKWINMKLEKNISPLTMGWYCYDTITHKLYSFSTSEEASLFIKYHIFKEIDDKPGINFDNLINNIKQGCKDNRVIYKTNNDRYNGASKFIWYKRIKLVLNDLPDYTESYIVYNLDK